MYTHENIIYQNKLLLYKVRVAACNIEIQCKLFLNLMNMNEQSVVLFVRRILHRVKKGFSQRLRCLACQCRLNVVRLSVRISSFLSPSGEKQNKARGENSRETRVSPPDFARPFYSLLLYFASCSIN